MAIGNKPPEKPLPSAPSRPKKQPPSRGRTLSESDLDRPLTARAVVKIARKFGVIIVTMFTLASGYVIYQTKELVSRMTAAETSLKDLTTRVSEIAIDTKDTRERGIPGLSNQLSALQASVQSLSNIPRRDGQ